MNMYRRFDRLPFHADRVQLPDPILAELPCRVFAALICQPGAEPDAVRRDEPHGRPEISVRGEVVIFSVLSNCQLFFDNEAKETPPPDWGGGCLLCPLLLSLRAQEHAGDHYYDGI